MEPYQSAESVDALTMAMDNRDNCPMGGLPRKEHKKREISLLMQTTHGESEEELTKITYVQWSKLHELKGRPLDIDNGKYVKCPVNYLVKEISFADYEPIVKATGTFVSAIKNDRSVLDAWVQTVHEVYQSSFCQESLDPASFSSVCVLCEWDSSDLSDYELQQQRRFGLKLHKCPLCRLTMHKKCAYDLSRSPKACEALHAKCNPCFDAGIFPRCIRAAGSSSSVSGGSDAAGEAGKDANALLAYNLALSFPRYLFTMIVFVVDCD